jgi:hypothetical protein
MKKEIPHVTRVTEMAKSRHLFDACWGSSRAFQQSHLCCRKVWNVPKQPSNSHMLPGLCLVASYTIDQLEVGHVSRRSNPAQRVHPSSSSIDRAAQMGDLFPHIRPRLVAMSLLKCATDCGRCCGTKCRLREKRTNNFNFYVFRIDPL